MARFTPYTVTDRNGITWLVEPSPRRIVRVEVHHADGEITTKEYDRETGERR